MSSDNWKVTRVMYFLSKTSSDMLDLHIYIHDPSQESEPTSCGGNLVLKTICLWQSSPQERRPTCSGGNLSAGAASRRTNKQRNVSAFARWRRRINRSIDTNIMTRSVSFRFCGDIIMHCTLWCRNKGNNKCRNASMFPDVLLFFYPHHIIQYPSQSLIKSVVYM